MLNIGFVVSKLNKQNIYQKKKHFKTANKIILY